MIEMFTFLATWTPFLAIGFLWNVAVTILAVAFGTAVGAVLVSVRMSSSGAFAKIGDFLSRVFRNVPTLALLFFAVFVLPREFTLWGTSLNVEIPLWFKAALGLSGSVIGFTSESLLIARESLRRKDYGAAMLFVPTWGSSVMISFIASSTASLVGVSELISRSNSIIAATGTSYLVPVYLYCAMFFILGCVIWMALINQAKESLIIRRFLERSASN